MLKQSQIIKPDLVTTDFLLEIIPHNKQTCKAKLLYRHSEYLLEAKKDF